MPASVLCICGNRLAGSMGLAVLLALAAASKSRAGGTLVEFQTSLGNFQVRLYDAQTPVTVANFLSYATGNYYDNTFIHRNPSHFVVQGGGFRFDAASNSGQAIAKFAPILNEPGISNVRGTIAMAKLGPPDGQPPTPATINSATNEWFFNLGDNASNLDAQNGGFTVFGRVSGSGMGVLDAIDALAKFDLDPPSSPTASNPGLYDDVPIRSTPTTGTVAQRLVYITDVRVAGTWQDGDYNFNGTVDGTDLLLWQRALGTATANPADGNGDRIVDGGDLAIWRSTLGQINGASTAAALAAPEPATAALAAAALHLLASRRRRTTTR